MTGEFYPLQLTTPEALASALSQDAEAVGQALSGNAAAISHIAAAAALDPSIRRGWFGRNVRPPRQVFAVMSSAPTVAALATTSAIGTRNYYAPLTTAGLLTGVTYPSEYWRYLGCSSPVIYGTVNPDYNYVRFNSFTLPAANAVGAYGVEFWHYGTQLEFRFKGVTGAYQILVDDELVQAAPFTVTNTGLEYYQTVTFGSAAVRKIRFLGYNLPWGGVNTGVTDTIWPTEAKGPRVVFLGDSYTNGTASTGGALTSWASYAAESLGWTDRFHAYAGGSGYTVDGTGVKFADRVANDVVAQSPDIVVVAGGHNDTGASAGTLQSAVTDLLAAIRAGLPNALLVVTSAMWGTGPEVFGGSTAAYYAQRDAKRAAALAAGAVWVDFMEMPILNGRVPSSGTLSASTLVNATQWKTTTMHPEVMSYVKIGAGATYDVQRVKGIPSFSAGEWTVDTRGLGYAHASGEPWVTVGQPFITGTGKAGAPAGDGNADVFTDSDGTHWTNAGHAAAGRAFAGMYSQRIGY